MTAPAFNPDPDPDPDAETSARRAPPAITVRRLPEGPNAATPRHWFDGLAFETHFFNALSSTFPEGERFFIQAVRHYAPQVEDPALQAQVKAFIGQEGQHSREHDGHMALLEAQGFTGLARANAVLHRICRFYLRVLPRYSLAVTIAIEHVTAVFAHHLLGEPARWLDRMHPDMQPLWRWHAVEETEHKAVAFDVYRATGGGEVLRALAMLHVMVFMFAEFCGRHLYLLYVDGVLGDAAGWRRGTRFLWGRGGLLRLAFRDLLAYLRPGFHPWQRDDRDLLARTPL